MLYRFIVYTMKERNLPFPSQTIPLEGCHMVDLVLMNHEHIEFPLLSDMKGQDVINIIESKGISDYVILNQAQNGMLGSILYTSSDDQDIIENIGNKNFDTSKLSQFIIYNMCLVGNQQRLILHVWKRNEYLFQSRLIEERIPNYTLFKEFPTEQILVLFPNGLVLEYQLKTKRSISRIHNDLYEKLVYYYGSDHVPQESSFRFGTIDTYCFPDYKEKFAFVPEMMNALKKQLQNPTKPYFTMNNVVYESDFTRTLSEYAESLNLTLPFLSPEIQQLYASMSKVRQDVLAARSDQIKKDPLILRMRTSDCDPPLFTCSKVDIVIKAELRGSLKGKNTATGASIKVDRTMTADEAIDTLHKKIENHQRITIGKPAKDFVLVLFGTEEVIAGSTPLDNFVCVRQFLLSNSPVLNVLLAEKDQIVESIMNKELKLKPLGEPDPNTFTSTLSYNGTKSTTFGKKSSIPHSKILSPYSLTLKRFRNVPPQFKGRRLRALVSLMNGRTDLCVPYLSDPLISSSSDVPFNERVVFPLHVAFLPRTARLSIVLYDMTSKKVAVAATNVPVYGFDGWLACGPQRRRMWSNADKGYMLTNSESTDPSDTTVEFDLDVYAAPVAFDTPSTVTSHAKKGIVTVEIQRKLDFLRKVDPLYKLKSDDRHLIWKHRHKFFGEPRMLPLVLQSVDYTSPSQVAEVPWLLQNWTPPEPAAALTLLGADFPDYNVRQYAVEQLDRFNDSELMLYLLQMVQCLKYELYANSPLACFLLRRGLMEPKFLGHQLFWQLMSEAHLSHIHARFAAFVVNMMYGMDSYRDELITGYRFTQMLVKLNEELCNLSHTEASVMFRKRLADIEIPAEFHLPMDPRLVVDSFIIEQCKVMNSKKKPFWLTFKNAAPFATEPIRTMFKVGDDLRQDQLTLQMLKVMEHLWRQNQMDLRMNCYGVLPTGLNQGFIEVVRNATTEMELQQEKSRLTGSFDPTVYLNFIVRSNQSERLYEIAQDNFMLSSAGYAVATCVLGVADRHPGNIMIQNDGHYFHIDFGHFLGNFKKKFGYQRENAPFHFSPACAIALEGVGSERWSKFEEICCTAFNILRHNADDLMQMLLLMLGTGIPELQKPEDIDYMRSMLVLPLNDKEAEMHFRALIQMSMDSTKTAINNWIHNLVVS